MLHHLLYRVNESCYKVNANRRDKGTVGCGGTSLWPMAGD
jgi:hypothetical protein